MSSLSSATDTAAILLDFRSTAVWASTAPVCCSSAATRCGYRPSSSSVLVLAPRTVWPSTAITGRRSRTGTSGGGRSRAAS
jgi:hypothetical protein